MKISRKHFGDPQSSFNQIYDSQAVQIATLKSLEEVAEGGRELPIERWRTADEQGENLSNDNSLNIEDFAETQD